MKVIARIVVLSIAAAMFIALSGIWARSIHPNFRNEREMNRTVRRKRGPELFRLTSFVTDIVIIGLIAFGGRKILRIGLIRPQNRS